MKKVLIPVLGAMICMAVWAFRAPAISVNPATEMAAENVKWYTWEEAIAANEKNPKKLVVDVYTDWCGWCKRMDAGTFSEATVAAYLNKNFYPIKLDAEQKGDIKYKDHVFTFDSSAGRRGAHNLAITLLDGRMGYPSLVYLDEEQARITVAPGYQTAEDFIKQLKFIAEEHYKTKTFQDYLSSAQ